MRKKLLLSILVLFAVTGCSVVNQIRMRFANDHLAAQWPDKKNDIVLSARYISNKPHVYVEINDQEGFLFLIDSGASITYLMDSPNVAKLNLDKGFDLIATGWGDEEDSTAYQVKVNQLGLSGVSFSDVSMAYLPVAKSPYFARPDEVVIDGVLGHDVLKHFVWRFDKKQNHIEISQSAYQPGISDTAVDFNVSMSKLSIPVEIDLGQGHIINRDVLIDTGSRHFFKLSQTFLDEESIVLDLPSVVGADFGLSGKAVHQRVTLPGIKIGQLYLENIKTNLIETEDPDDLWIIGSAALNQYISVLDYKQNTLFLSQYEDVQFRSQYNLLGLELRKIISGEFVVRYVMPEMATASLDFKAGDLITAINGVKSEDMSEDEWLEISNQPGEYEICRIRSSEQDPTCVQATSKHIEGYSKFNI
ncbi:aspartyl protease family protein [Alteromonas antoniana]|uniref:aspartyl protease family protein n=1 Tax=Alteromonas antoniana TaxID=2803813 RepID=UPI001C45C1CA|nr:aspartyl protease family protein [Alteromonas antoniana]